MGLWACCKAWDALGVAFGEVFGVASGEASGKASGKASATSEDDACCNEDRGQRAPEEVLRSEASWVPSDPHPRQLGV